MSRTTAPRPANRAAAALLTLALALLASGCGSFDAPADDEIAWSHYGVKKVCGTSGKTLAGIDVSKWQATIDWPKVAADGIEFGIARASHGLNFDDAYFTANWQAMKANGIVRGVYQFFAPTQDPIQQADFMLKKIKDAGGIEAGDLPPVLDLEVTDGASPSALQAAALAWLQHVEAKTGKTPIIYTAAYFAQSNLKGALKKYPLWIANYTTPPDEGGCPLLPDNSWTRWDMWQWSSKGSVAGVKGNCDVNVFDGDMAALQAFIAAHTKGGNTNPGGTAPSGALESVSCSAVTGWAFDADTPAQPVTVELYVDTAPDQPGATPIVVSANLKRNDLCTSLGSCDHGLSWIIPSAYRDGAEHTLYAQAVDTADGTKHDLSGTAATFTCATAQGGDSGTTPASDGPSARGDAGVTPPSDGAASGDGDTEARGGCAVGRDDSTSGYDLGVLALIGLLLLVRRRRRER